MTGWRRLAIDGWAVAGSILVSDRFRRVRLNVVGDCAESRGSGNYDIPTADIPLASPW